MTVVRSRREQHWRNSPLLIDNDGDGSTEQVTHTSVLLIALTTDRDMLTADGSNVPYRPGRSGDSVGFTVLQRFAWHPPQSRFFTVTS